MPETMTVTFNGNPQPNATRVWVGDRRLRVEGTSGFDCELGDVVRVALLFSDGYRMDAIDSMQCTAKAGNDDGVGYYVDFEK